MNLTIKTDWTKNFPNAQMVLDCVIGAIVLITFCQVAFVLSATESSQLIEEGNNQLHIQNATGALAKFDRAVLVAPYNGRAHLYRAIACSRLGQFDRAGQELSAARAMGVPEELLVLLNATNQCSKGDYAGGEMSARSLVDRGNNDPHVLLVLGTCQSRLGHDADAIKNLTQAIDLSNSSEVRANAFYERALLEQKEKNQSAALADVGKSLGLNPKTSAYLLQADIFKGTKHFKEAIVVYTRVLAERPEDTSVLTARGICYARIADREHAIRDFTRCLQIDQNCLESYIQRGNVYMQQRRYKQALSDFQIAQKLSPTLVEVNRKLKIAESKLN